MLTHTPTPTPPPPESDFFEIVDQIAPIIEGIFSTNVSTIIVCFWTPKPKSDNFFSNCAYKRGQKTKKLLFIILSIQNCSTLNPLKTPQL